MQRVDTIDGLFSNGNQATGLKGTVLNATWLNSFQEELAGVVEGGGYTLSADDQAQLARLLLGCAGPNRPLCVQEYHTAFGGAHSSWSAAFAAAVAAAAPYQTLLVPPMTYDCTAGWTPLVLDKPLRWVGYGATLAGAGGIDWAQVQATQQFAGLGWTGPWADILDLNTLTAAIDLEMDDCSVSGAGRVAYWSNVVGAGALRRLMVNRLTARALTGQGLYLVGPMAHAHVDRLDLDGAVSRGVQLGEDVYSMQDSFESLRVTNSKIKNVATTGYTTYGLILYGRHGAVSNCELDTISSDTEVSGIYTKCRYVRVNNNVVKSVGGGAPSLYAINVKGALRVLVEGDDSPQGYGAAVQGNHVWGGDRTGVGIRIQNQDVRALGNLVEDYQTGIAVLASTSPLDNCQVGHNEVYLSATTASSYGVLVVNPGAMTLVHTNQAFGPWSEAYRLAPAVTGGAVANVKFSDNQSNGAAKGFVFKDVDGGSALTLSLTNNQLRGCTTYSMSFEGTYAPAELDVVGNDLRSAPVNWGGTASPSKFTYRGNKEQIVQTTSATLTTLAKVALADECAVIVRATVVAKLADSSQRAAYVLTACWYRDAAGAATQQGATTKVAIESVAGWDADFYAVSTDELHLRVTGAAGSTIDWTGTLEVEMVS